MEMKINLLNLNKIDVKKVSANKVLTIKKIAFMYNGGINAY